MKKRKLKSLKFSKKLISSLQGGRSDNDTSNIGKNLTADIKDCPDNTLKDGCESMGFCPQSFWC